MKGIFSACFNLRSMSLFTKQEFQRIEKKKYKTWNLKKKKMYKT